MRVQCAFELIYWYDKILQNPIHIDSYDNIKSSGLSFDAIRIRNHAFILNKVKKYLSMLPSLLSFSRVFCISLVLSSKQMTEWSFVVLTLVTSHILMKIASELEDMMAISIVFLGV